MGLECCAGFSRLPRVVLGAASPEIARVGAPEWGGCPTLRGPWRARLWTRLGSFDQEEMGTGQHLPAVSIRENRSYFEVPG